MCWCICNMKYELLFFFLDGISIENKNTKVAKFDHKNIKLEKAKKNGYKYRQKLPNQLYLMLLFQKYPSLIVLHFYMSA
jgi:hypothetical protein